MFFSHVAVLLFPLAYMTDRYLHPVTVYHLAEMRHLDAIGIQEQFQVITPVFHLAPQYKRNTSVPGKSYLALFITAAKFFYLAIQHINVHHFKYTGRPGDVPKMSPNKSCEGC